MVIEPVEVFRNFELISAIPRGSRNEKAVSDYLTAFARKLGLWVHQDQAFNVIIRKPASPGYENAPTVVLQGHLDMVCEKNRDVVHDFLSDGIKLSIDGDFIKAVGTTLGADNGIAIAMCMALLEDNSLKHPALEILLTSDEESGMTGANNLDPTLINGRLLINLDSEEEGVFIASCAGGLDVLFRVPIETTVLPSGYTPCALTVDGLCGGHSGSDIHKEFANSNILLCRALCELDAFDCYIYDIWGGAKANAIPREAEAKLAIKNEDYESLSDKIAHIAAIFKKEYANSDPGVNLVLTPVQQMPLQAFTKACSNKILLSGRLLPNGVQHMCMSEKLSGLVETSTNLGVITVKDGFITLHSALRSSVFSRMRELADRMHLLAAALDVHYEEGKAYPAWEFDNDSKLQKFFMAKYREYTGKDATLTAMHAGIECGLFAEKLNMPDMISLGPNMYYVHTPDERLSISSTARTWAFLKFVLGEISSTY